MKCVLFCFSKKYVDITSQLVKRGSRTPPLFDETEKLDWRSSTEANICLSFVDFIKGILSREDNIHKFKFFGAAVSSN